MSDAVATVVEEPKKSRTLLAVLLLVLAIVLFGAAFAWAGGVDYVTGLLGGGAKLASNSLPSPAAAAPAKSPDESEFAKRLYVEQLESAENIRLLGEGRMSTIAISKVDVVGDLANVGITAEFTDKSKVDGVVVMGRSAGKWYFLALSGLRTGETADLTRFTRVGTALEDTHTPEQALAALGMGTFDEGILATLIEQQSADQKLAQGIVDGTYSALAFGTPERGAGTVSVPVELTTKKGTEPGMLVMVTKQIDGRDRIFITSLKDE